MELTDRIKFILAQEKLSQKAFADSLNASAQTVHNWIKRNSISREAAQQISEVYGYSLDWLLNGIGEPKIQKRIESQIPDDSEFLPVRVWDKSTPIESDEVEVPFLRDIEFACGDGSYSDSDYNGYKLRFSK